DSSSQGEQHMQIAGVAESQQQKPQDRKQSPSQVAEAATQTRCQCAAAAQPRWWSSSPCSGVRNSRSLQQTQRSREEQ
ncbi:hypothetical protein Dimus_022633, partial [Dionaea muscipula]